MVRVKLRIAATAFCAFAITLVGCSNEDAGKKPNTPKEASHVNEYYARYADDAVLSEARLKSIIAPFFEDPDQSETRAVVVLHKGVLVAERYAPGYSPEMPLVSWSMAKTVTSILTGMMVADGRLTLDDPAPVPEWHAPGDPRKAITLRHLLNMVSGLDHSETPDAENGLAIHEVDTTRMLFLPDGRDNVARYAETRILEAKPGTHFEYSTPTSHILSDIITRQLTNSKMPQERLNRMMEYAKGRLFEPLGMEKVIPEFDASGTMLGGSIMHARPRDWAKVGEFLRNNGAVKGAQLLPANWVRFMLTPSQQDAAYGGHIWLNRRRPQGRDQVLFPGKAPDDVFALIGHLGQFVVVSPQHSLVIVRMGHTPDKQMDPINTQLARVINAFPNDDS